MSAFEVVGVMAVFVGFHAMVDQVPRQVVRVMPGIEAEIIERADVVVSRDGWVTHKAHDSLVGYVSRDVNGAGQPIWRASAGDIGSFAFKRADAVETVIEIHNIQEKARAYDRVIRYARKAVK